jgi:glycosyltransferase involved in cell wall biosynthesis
MSAMKPLVSIVIPVFNEEDNVLPTYETLRLLIDGICADYDFEFVFTDNHSTDKTSDILRALALGDSRVKAFRFSRNVGYQKSILTAYLKCSGDVAIQLDVDLQDPPELIPVFLAEWEKGADVVYGIRKSRLEARRWQYARRLFYWLVDVLSEDPIPQNAGDFRLISRRVIEQLRVIDDNQPYLRGTIASLGFKQVGIDYARRQRLIGSSKFRFYDNVMLALDGLINQSIAPLRLAIYIGLFIALATLVAILGYLIAYFTTGFRAPPGFTTITTLVLGSLCINAMLLGVIGEYLGRMYLQMKRKPISIVEEELHAR